MQHSCSGFALKRRPEDFIVMESPVPRICSMEKGRWWYLKLWKRCYTTFESVSILADFFGCDERDVGYSGLKDEDAVTEQTVSIPAKASRNVDEFNQYYSGLPSERSLRIAPLGYSREPLHLGALLGNGFSITVRDLPLGVAEQVAERRHSTLFLNFYDIQRFGVPGAPRYSHLVGRALQTGRYGDALELVAGSSSDQAPSAYMWSGVPQEFFSRLDPRIVSLYYNAAVSFDWNAQLSQFLQNNQSDSDEVIRDGLTFRFARDQETLALLLSELSELNYEKHRPGRDGTVVRTTSSRATVLQTQIEAGPVIEDDLHPGRDCFEVSLFLPAGAYATTVVAQFFHQQICRSDELL
ncbi:tRNA pseudouridine(13) synthase TruD [Streptomyces sp. NPDC057686]|uniref:tRNA pseudouridine(13) synthase TruD n=1 Tax=Streptomyces sp. NPDC057686 TaxID=3346212 RepID=UPI0036990BCC